jgi:acyl-CoA reductase-like NAD-dependent aldehyde dehydrogenase
MHHPAFAPSLAETLREPLCQSNLQTFLIAAKQPHLSDTTDFGFISAAIEKQAKSVAAGLSTSSYPFVMFAWRSNPPMLSGAFALAGVSTHDMSTSAIALADIMMDAAKTITFIFFIFISPKNMPQLILH